jgi:signal-transduction protein with cAMP-binding, CBS, and nucleotidyltransferase domain
MRARRYNARMPDAKIGRASDLARVSIFSDLSETELKFVSDRAVTKRYAAGELIFSEGDLCPGVYVIESGEVAAGRVCDKSHRHGSAVGLRNVELQEGAGHVHPIREYHLVWFVRTPLSDPSEHLSRRASLLALLR